MANFSGIMISIMTLFLLGLSSLFSPGAVSAEPAQLSESALVEIGRRIYQKGEMVDGAPIKAFVLGDIAVTGTQFSCLSCHRRSGLGGQEGTKFVLPTNSVALLNPRVNLHMERPAYTLETFADSLRRGVNPVGKTLDQVMPRYDLPDLEVRALFAYLKTLSNDYSPGLTSEELHVATVVGKDVEPQRQKEMLDVLSSFFGNKNNKTRNEKRRLQAGPFYQAYRNQAYRRWIHHVWELSGTAESWPDQLEKYYQRQPVFAMLSGLVDGSWEPIHDFCRDKKLPCLLPNTDLPTIENPVDFYTLYYSRGMTLEAEVLGDAISATGSLVQLSRQGEAALRGVDVLREILLGKDIRNESILLVAGSENWELVRQQIEQMDPDLIVLWLDEVDLDKFSTELASTVGTTPIYLSSALLNGSLDSIPAAIAKHGKVVYPFVLPKNQQDRFRLVAAWLRANHIPLTNPRIQGQTYYSCMLLNAGLGHIKQNFYREYLLDLLDHGDKMAAYSGNYPRLSFGPEQRFLAKGAYVIDLDTGKARWVTPGH